MTTKSAAVDAAKENNRSARLSTTAGKDDTMKAAKERATSKKRAASIGGDELDTLLKESSTKANATVASTSRRNAPAPRKSAIRQVPQIFLSPTGLVPSPESRKGLAMPSLTEQIAQIGRPEPETSGKSIRSSLPHVNATDRNLGLSSFANVGKARDSMQATSFGSLGGAATSILSAPNAAAPAPRSAMTQVIRPKRRVTFSSRQEKTEFARDEPTLRLGSLRREQVSPPSTPASSSVVSAGFASYIQSQDDSSSESNSESESESESDMDLDASNELAARSLAASIAASLPHDDSTLDPSMDASADESNASASSSSTNMDFTGTHGSVNKRALADTSDDQVSMSLAAGGEESMQMDITQSLSAAPALKRRRSSNTAADVSASTDASDSTEHGADASSSALDQTTTMEFTGVHAPVNGDEDSEDSDHSDASDGMEMTKAITTRIEAKKYGDATTTIITNFPDTGSSDSEGDDTIQPDATLPMEMTRVVTGFIREKDHASSDMDFVDSSSSAPFGLASSDDFSEAMDMTMPMGSNVSPSKPSQSLTRTPTKLGTGAPSPFQPTPGKSPSRFRQSLRGGMAALEANTHSPAQRVGGPLPPQGHVSHAGVPSDSTSFRRSIIGGVASPAYQHSPARRIQTQEAVDRRSGAPLTADNLAQASRLTSVRAAGASPSSKNKVPVTSAVAGQRKSLSSVGFNWPSGPVASTSRFSPSKGLSPKRRAGRSSLVAAILPDSSSAASNEDSFHSAVESGIRSANGASSEPHDNSIAHSAASDIGVGVDSFDDYSNDERNQVPVQMPLNDFLRFVGVHFNDDMSASRRKPVPPARGEQAAEDGASSEPQAPVSMMRLVKAACGTVPQLEALREACREIKEQVDDGREKMVEMEQAFYDSPPDFVREIMGLQNEEERRDMEAQFKLQKQAARALVSADYYGWRLDKEFDQEMIQTLQAYHGRLQCDLHIVNSKKEQLQQEILPVLRVKHAKLKADLALAKRRQAEIETCDAEELKGLYSSIEEQHEVLESMRAKLMDIEEQHERLLVRLEENREKMAAAQEMVDKAHATVDQIQGYTRGEAGRLLREIRNLEKLHLVRILDNGFDPSLDEVEDGADSLEQGSGRDVVLILDGWLQVSMSLLASSTSRQLPNNSKVSRIQLKQKGTRASNDDTNLVRKLSVQILQSDFDVEFADGVPQDALVILRRISQTLIRQRILLAEIEHLRCRFPVQLLDDMSKFPSTILNGSLDTSTSSSAAAERVDNEVALQASVLLPNKRSKIVITATSDLKGAGESRSILLADSVRVERVYGSVDAEAMSLQILDCIETDPTIGSLSKAFIETIETFDS
ncbi:chromosome segregation protein [Pseudozyma hubeiensis SY62]|uniref:Chromosome segregation protein n=1 Tax=Pseudozyma hubeiensis (strain SY62) TaxID=1305764 RepID=R9P5V9_PSEHS|nr:chromosome segregation protein [Pseudozyma hubeiensis SY62]GAC96714.1 chromosome segregation protein [Pseudozyma hubeiensis SY62]